MSYFCGFDFGTSNSTLGVYLNNQSQLIPFAPNRYSIRSAIFCDNEAQQWIFGEEGVKNYLEGIPGRLMMAIKSVLGSALMEEKTAVFDQYISYTEILQHFIHYIKSLAETRLQQDLTHVVLGRPVHFHDTDLNKDLKAQNTLEQIAREVGFKEVAFQFEPIAAALAYETTINKEQLALIVDMGGGTSDFTIIRLRPGAVKIERAEDVLANEGIHIAGSDFDQRLNLEYVMPLLGRGSLMKGSSSDILVPSSYYHDLTRWHMLSQLYTPGVARQIQSIQTIAYEKVLLARLLKVIKNKIGHHILNAVEKAKQSLSDVLEQKIDLSFIEDGLRVFVTQQQFNNAIEYQLTQITATIEKTIKIAQVNHADIQAIFYTGGTTKIPIIRTRIQALLPQAICVQGDAFGSVGLGLTLDAQRRYQ